MTFNYILKKQLLDVRIENVIFTVIMAIWFTVHLKSECMETHRKEKKSIEPNRTFDFRTRDLCKTDVENPLPDLRSSS